VPNENSFRAKPPRLQREQIEPSEPGAPATFLIWLSANDDDTRAADGLALGTGAAPSDAHRSVPRRVVSTDPQYEEHLMFLEHHPGFLAALMVLARSPSEETFERFAMDWRIEPDDVRHMAEAQAPGALHGVRLPPLGARVRVEVYPGELVLHVPQPVSPTSRETIMKWARDAHKHPELWSTEQAAKGGPPAGKAAHEAPNAVTRLEWYDRWHAGESPHAIWDLLPQNMALMINEWGVRNTLQQIH
jgi:hypothetical protein